MKVGVLALQGGFSLHEARLAEIGQTPLRVATSHDLAKVSALVLPGGESSTLLKLCGPEFRAEIVRAVESGMPALATCAGLILFASRVTNPSQESLGLIDVEVRRNAYGRQRESFITRDMRWTSQGSSLLSALGSAPEDVEGVFIRAPQISQVGKNVQVLLEHTPKDRPAEPVLVRDRNRFGATFHPELSPGSTLIHRLFLEAAER